MGLSGEELSLNAGADSAVSSLKDDIALQMHIPKICLSLVRDATELEDTGKVVEICGDDGTGSIHLSLIVSLDVFCKGLDSKSTLTLTNTLVEMRMLRDGNPVIRKQATCLVVPYVAHNSGDVRFAAAKTVGEIATVNDDEVVNALTSRLDVSSRECEQIWDIEQTV